MSLTVVLAIHIPSFCLAWSRYWPRSLTWKCVPAAPRRRIPCKRCGTVKIHLHNVYKKLGIANRVDLTLYAQKRGLV